MLMIVMTLLTTCVFAGCGSRVEYRAVSGLDLKNPCIIRIAIPYETDKALNAVANAFTEKYPNVTVELEYVEDYETKSVELLKKNMIDIILRKDQSYTEYTQKDENTGDAVPTGFTTEDYFYDFYSDSEIDLSNTTPDISNNYRHTRVDEEGNEKTYQYCYPLGGETRGVFVNTTLLDFYGLSVPTNYTELLACCQKLKEAGLVPIQGGGDTAAYGLGMAAAANEIVHDDEKLDILRNATPGVSLLFSGTLEKMYTIATNRYFDYKAVEKDNYFLSTNELGQVESFLGLRLNQDTLEMELPENGYGYAAFWPYISSTQTVVQSQIDKYGLDTKFTFICSPLNEEGENSPVYITPFYGVCINKKQ